MGCAPSSAQVKPEAPPAGRRIHRERLSISVTERHAHRDLREREVQWIVEELRRREESVVQELRRREESVVQERRQSARLLGDHQEKMLDGMTELFGMDLALGF
eukprot:TRINITY_DN4688_c0_g1_i5.p3 TRINITY_DN4688_c0_g1~~TRINITY_DN4688_c0_g1_i5.p3  ORF type:complete len:104 (-),score=22.02 TRINITY_DN4688_c0_g1_i5:559-870(-)